MLAGRDAICRVSTSQKKDSPNEILRLSKPAIDDDLITIEMELLNTLACWHVRHQAHERNPQNTEE